MRGDFQLREVRDSKDEQLRQLKASQELKQLKAEQLRSSKLQEIVRKAQEEEIKVRETLGGGLGSRGVTLRRKVSEISFINTLEAQNRKMEYEEKTQGHEARLQNIEEERQRKREEQLAKEEAAQVRERKGERVKRTTSCIGKTTSTGGRTIGATQRGESKKTGTGARKIICFYVAGRQIYYWCLFSSIASQIGAESTRKGRDFEREG